MPIKFWVVGGGGGGGLLHFKVYLSPLLGEGVQSRIERFRERVQEMLRECSERGRERGECERERGETREERDCDNWDNKAKQMLLLTLVSKSK